MPDNSKNSLEQSKKNKTDNSVLIRKKSLWFLAIREHSSFEIFHKLEKAGFDLDEINQEISELKKQNFLSDERFCEMFINSRKSQGHGPIKIIYELKNHRIDETLIKENMDSLSDFWFELAKEVRLKKFGQNQPKNWNEKAKQMRFLQSRGFELEHINHSFND